VVRIGGGGAAAEFVDGEGERYEGEGEVETALPEFSGGLSGDWERRGREGGRCRRVEGRDTPRDSLTGSG